MNTSRNPSTTTGAGTGDIEQGAAAVTRAEAGVSSWEDAVRLQRWAAADHADFYALAGEIVSTLHALDDLAQVLHRQVGDYAQGRRVYDDTRQVDPGTRLEIATTALEELRSGVVAAADWANTFWSAIRHIGVERNDGTETAGGER